VNDFDLHTAVHCTQSNALPETQFFSNCVYQDLPLEPRLARIVMVLTAFGRD
jgi:hypothetical protein